MNTPKLPPLPAVDLRDVGTREKDIQEFLAGYATAYAIAAIEAQGVPDGWQLVRTDALKMAIDFAVPAMERDRDSPSNSAWMVEAADRNINAVRAMLASAPPAPQASTMQKWPVSQDPLTQLQVAAIISERGESSQASVVQQEPVVRIHTVVTG